MTIEFNSPEKGLDGIHYDNPNDEERYTSCRRSVHGRLRITDEIKKTTCKACRRTLNAETEES